MSTRNVMPLSGLNLIFVGFMVLTTWAVFLHGAEYECPPSWMLFSSSCYYIVGDSQTWADASGACQGYGAWMVEIESDAENAFIRNNLGRNTAFWIDCRDDISEGDWLCGDDNHPITYTAWNPREPNNVDNEDCIFTNNGVWYDITCGSEISTVCKRAAVASTRSMTLTFKKDESNPCYCLRNNVIEEIQPSTLIYCGGRCLQSTECASVNYHPYRKKCQLNSRTKAEADDSDFTEVYNCAYYDIL